MARRPLLHAPAESSNVELGAQATISTTGYHFPVLSPPGRRWSIRRRRTRVRCRSPVSSRWGSQRFTRRDRWIYGPLRRLRRFAIITAQCLRPSTDPRFMDNAKRSVADRDGWPTWLGAARVASLLYGLWLLANAAWWATLLKEDGRLTALLALPVVLLWLARRRFALAFGLWLLATAAFWGFNTSDPGDFLLILYVGVPLLPLWIAFIVAAIIVAIVRWRRGARWGCRNCRLGSAARRRRRLRRRLCRRCRAFPNHAGRLCGGDRGGARRTSGAGYACRDRTADLRLFQVGRHGVWLGGHCLRRGPTRPAGRPRRARTPGARVTRIPSSPAIPTCARSAVTSTCCMPAAEGVRIL